MQPNPSYILILYRQDILESKFITKEKAVGREGQLKNPHCPAFLIYITRSDYNSEKARLTCFSICCTYSNHSPIILGSLEETQFLPAIFGSLDPCWLSSLCAIHRALIRKGGKPCCSIEYIQLIKITSPDPSNKQFLILDPR